MNNSKNKFITNTRPSNDFRLPQLKKDCIDFESSLLTPAINRKDKIQMKLDNILDPSNYNINYKNSLRKDKNEINGFYYTNRESTLGRGFGNLDISNNIRYGDASRNSTKEYKKQQEESQIFDYQFQYVDTNAQTDIIKDKYLQNPNNLILPFSRGGDSTRRKNSLF